MATQLEMTPSEQYALYYGEKAPVPAELSFYTLGLSELLETINLDIIQNNPSFSRSVLTSAEIGASWLENNMQETSNNFVENAVAAWTLLNNFGAVNLSQEGAETEILPVAEELAQRQGAAIENAKRVALETRRKANEIISIFSQAYVRLLKKQTELEEKRVRAEAAHKRMQEQAAKEAAKHVTTTELFVEATERKKSETPKELRIVKNTLKKVDNLLKKLGELANNTFGVSSLSSSVTVATTT